MMLRKMGAEGIYRDLRLRRPRLNPSCSRRYKV
jgi:hypothetical protein